MTNGQQQPCVSVVIPVYNVAPYLEKCVASVTAQTWKNIEIILVDDGSTDQSGQLCDKLAACDARIQVIHQENQGLAGARNVGMARARGEYLLFLDSDDYWGREQAVEEILNMLRAEEDPVDCVLFSFTKKDLSKQKQLLKKLAPLPESANVYQKKMLLLKRRQYSNSACSKLYRLQFLRENQLAFPLGKKSEDLIFSQKVLAKMRFFLLYSPSVLVYQINRPGSITTSFTNRNYEDILHQMMQAVEELKNTNAEERELGMAYWAEQLCWFLGYLPINGKPINVTLEECGELLHVLKWGVSRRVYMVRLLIGCFGKKKAVHLLHEYLMWH